MKFLKLLSTLNGFIIVFSTLGVFLIIIGLYLKKNYKKKTGDILLSLFFIGISIIFYLLTFLFPETQGVGPAIIPRLWVVILIPLNIYVIIKTFKESKPYEKEESHISTVLIFIAIIIIYLLSMKYIGYYISSFIFLYLTMYLLGNRNYIEMAIISAGWLLFSYLAFYKLLYVPLPVGKLIEFLFY